MHALDTVTFETHVLMAAVARIRSAGEAQGVMVFSQAATPRMICCSAGVHAPSDSIAQRTALNA